MQIKIEGGTVADFQARLESIMHIPIAKRTFYNAGGFANPDLFRRMRNGAWRYFRKAE